MQTLSHLSPTFSWKFLGGCALLLIAWGSLSAQITEFQFPLDLGPSRISPVEDLIETQQGDYLFTSFVSGGTSINVTRIDYGTGVKWSKDLSFSDVVVNPKIVEWPQENAFLVAGFALTNDQNRILVKLDQNGNVLWSRRYGGFGDVYVANRGLSDLVVLPSGNVLFAGGASQIVNSTGPDNLFLGKVDGSGALLFGRTLCFSCIGALSALADMTLLSDGNVAITGIMTPQSVFGGPTEDLLLMKVDTSGGILWTKAFNNPVGFFGGDEFGREVRELPNGKLVVSGVSFSFSPSFQDGLILETNANGSFSRAQQVNISNGSHDVEFNHIIPIDNNTVVVPGSSNENVSPSLGREYNFLTQIQLNGTIDWRWSYFSETSVGYLTFENALVERQQGGFAYMANFARFFDNLYPVLLSTDNLGQTGCDSLINLTSSFVALTESTFTVTSNVTNSSANYSATSSNFSGYNFFLPDLDLGPDTSLCSIINLQLNADVGLPATYNWSTGQNSSSITVNADGTYYVTVSLTDQCIVLEDSFTVRCDSVLPISFNDFEAVAIKDRGPNRVRLNWFVQELAPGIPVFIERSEDGKDFEEIGQQWGGGFSIYEDLTPRNGWSFYRLSTVDIDGSVIRSRKREVFVAEKEGWIVKNDLSSGDVEVDFLDAEFLGGRLWLIDGKGRRVGQWRIDRGQPQRKIPKAAFAKGIYRLLWMGNDGQKWVRSLAL